MDIGHSMTNGHLRIHGCLSAISRSLQELRAADAPAREALQDLKKHTKLLADCLADCLESEYQLEPIVEHVFGCGLEEISNIPEHQNTLREALRVFLQHIKDAETVVRRGDEVETEPIEGAFEGFVTAYEDHADLERGFFSAYSGVLFPASTQ